LFSKAQNQFNAIGEWREQNSFDSIVNIINGDQMYITNGAEILGLNDRNFHLGKSTGLHNASIKKIVWNQYNSSIITIYNNNQIDVINGDQINAINDIYNTTLYSNKSINDVFVTDFNKAIIATDFGIAVTDLNQLNISETWFPNNQRNQEKTYAALIKGDTLYALTEMGLKYCSLQNHIPNNNWVVMDQYKGCNKMIVNANVIWLSSYTEIYKYPNTTKSIQVTNGDIFKIKSTNNQLYVIVKNYAGNGYYRNITNYNNNVIVDSSFGFQPLDIEDNKAGQYIATNNNGLTAMASNSATLLPGPKHKLSSQTVGFDNQMITNYKYVFPGVGFYNELDGWSTIPNSNLHYNNVAIQNKDKKLWVATTNKINSWDPSNNQFSSIPYDSTLGVIKNMQANTEGDVWILQDKGFLFWNGSSWQASGAANSPIQFSSIKDFIVNDYGQIFAIPYNNQGLYVYQSKQYYSSETWQQLTTSSSSGNLPSNNVVAIAADKKGAIWIGTDNGIGIIYPDDISRTLPKAYLPIIKNNGFNGYLLQKEKIHCIAVNGANQKWIGTDNGAWLVSSDGNEVLDHLNTTNSYLQNDTIVHIAIIPETGEVFFISNQHASSYKAVATEPKLNLTNVSIYPNPVPPNFGGTIVIKNLTDNTIVKITDLNGKLVYQTRSQGGTAIWNGITYLGNKPSTGIYLVWMRDDSGEEKAVGKIMFTSNAN
jgi:ligand-binding sensor domain-containing protein